MKDLNQLKQTRNIDELTQLVHSITIFEKIEFSGITRKALKAKLDDLRTRQVPQRTVLLDMPDEEVVFYWFKNWLHPSLKHWVKPSSKDKRGATRRVLEIDYQIDALYFYENGQHMFDYTLEDIEAYIEETKE